jgi:polyisoprenoid-binding protein YceI
MTTMRKFRPIRDIASGSALQGELQGLSTSEEEIYLMSSTSRIAISSIATEDFSTWNIDPAHSAAEFKVRHMMISNVKGKFSGLSGVLKLDETHSATVNRKSPIQGA